jgi:hypothetical protein
LSPPSKKNGLEHTLRWIGGWYAQAAKARVSDEVSRALDEHADDPTAHALHLTDLLVSASSRGNNYSFSPGGNLFQQAEVSALSAELERPQSPYRCMDRALHKSCRAAAVCVSRKCSPFQHAISERVPPHQPGEIEIPKPSRKSAT